MAHDKRPGFILHVSPEAEAYARMQRWAHRKDPLDAVSFEFQRLYDVGAFDPLLPWLAPEYDAPQLQQKPEQPAIPPKVFPPQPQAIQTAQKKPEPDEDIDAAVAALLPRKQADAPSPSPPRFFSNNDHFIKHWAYARTVLLRDLYQLDGKTPSYWKSEYTVSGVQALKYEPRNLEDVLQANEDKPWESVAEGHRAWILMAANMHKNWFIRTGGERH